MYMIRSYMGDPIFLGRTGGVATLWPFMEQKIKIEIKWRKS